MLVPLFTDRVSGPEGSRGRGSLRRFTGSRSTERLDQPATQAAEQTATTQSDVTFIAVSSGSR